jgi:hypothetical protein
MDSLFTGGLIFGSVTVIIGALILALIHGFGYRVAGLADHKPGYATRFGMQLVTVFVSSAILYGASMIVTESGALLGALSSGISGAIILIVGLGVGSYYLGLTIVTFLIPATKQQFGVAARSAVLPSLVVLAIYLLPIFVGLSAG